MTEFSEFYLLVVVAMTLAFVLISVISWYALSKQDGDWMETWCQEHGYDDDGNRLENKEEMMQ